MPKIIGVNIQPISIAKINLPSMTKFVSFSSHTPQKKQEVQNNQPIIAIIIIAKYSIVSIVFKLNFLNNI